jgi:TldD protein
MSQTLELAQARLLSPTGMGLSEIDHAFSRLMGPGVDFGDLYFQHSRRESWTVEDGIVKDGAHSIEQGVGVRAISGEKTGFAYSDDIRSDALIESAGAARAISRDGGRQHAGQRIAVAGRSLYPAQDPIEGMRAED